MTSIDRNCVLLVGSSANRDLVAAALESAGFEVDHTENPYEATLRFDESRPGHVLVFLDGVEEEDLELIAALKRLAPASRVLVSFSLPHRHLAARAVELGADAYLLEPFHLFELVTLLRREPPAGEAATPKATGGAVEASPLNLEEFAGGVAHEINNPLTVVAGWIDVMLAEAAGDPQRSAKLQSILEETRRIQRVVDHLQSFARLAPGDPVRLDVNGEIRTFFDEETSAGSVAGLHIETRFDPELPPIRGDRKLLRDLFAQLTRNAVTATDGAGRLDVTTRRTASGDAQIVFADDGAGIPEEYRSRLFQPFFSGFAGDNRTGLGLAACRGIVHAHGGSIRLLERRDRGAAFEITFPADKGLPPDADSQ